MNMKIDLGERSYEIVIEKGSLSKLNSLLDLKRKILIVTDDGIPSQYVENVKSQCKDATVLVLPKGDTNKNLNSFEKIISTLVENQFTRSDAIIALGGGMVSDVAGYAASSYMRGIDFYIIPTTLLSQVDASIGGKVAVNYKGYKNLIGAFYQPKKVVIDVDTLDTLDERLFNEGLAEAIKVGATSNLALFELIEKSENIKQDVEKVITMALGVKKAIVEIDERESWQRQTLNFGHTVGHAIETLAKGKLYHGECVAIGMLYLTSSECVSRLEAVLEKYQLPTKDSYPSEDLLEIIKHDKKTKEGDIVVCTVEELGRNKLKRLSLSEIKQVIDRRKKQ